MRSIRAEQTSTRTFIGERAGETEALIERLFSILELRMDQTERSLEELLARIEAALTTPGRAEP